MEFTMVVELNRIGKTCFEYCYKIFRSNMNGVTSDDSAVEQIMAVMGCTESGAKIRLNYAKQIFKAGQHKEAWAVSKARTR